MPHPLVFTTVVTPPQSLLLTTVDAVKADLGIESDDNSQIFADIEAVSAQIDGYLDRNLARATLSQEFDFVGCWEDTIRLDRAPVASITSVSEDGTAIDASDYKLDAETGLLYRRSSSRSTLWRTSPAVVVYVGGYILPGYDGYAAGSIGCLPADIQKATVIACRALYQSRGRDPMVKSEALPGVIEQEYWVGTNPGQGESGLPIESERLLDSYVRLRLR